MYYFSRLKNANYIYSQTVSVEKKHSK